MKPAPLLSCVLFRIVLVVMVLTVPCGHYAAADELVIYADALDSGWADWSWSSTRNLSVTAPVQSGSHSASVTIDAGWGALYLHSAAVIDLSGYDTLKFWIHGGSTGGQKLQVIANKSAAAFAVTATANSWTQVAVPLASLGNPASLSDLYWQGTTNGSQPVFYLDTVSLTGSGVAPPPGAGPAITVDVAAGRHAISPDIYGMNFADEQLAAELRLPVRRRGGNSTSRYNWLNDTYNTGSDWYFENIPEDNPAPALLPNGSAADRFVEQDLRTGTRSLLTVPLIGWVAKQRKSGHPYDCGFKVSKYGPQESTDPWDSDCGNGIHSAAGITGNDPADTSTQITPAFVSSWVSHLIGRYGTAAQGGVAYYNLDNEPMLWNGSHRDVHPQPVTYDELRDRTVQYAPAVKSVDPTARTLGPVLWGWCAYFYSASDGCGAGPDYAAHGNTPFVPWYLKQMQSYEQLNGRRILDYLDLHYYPQANGVSLGTAGDAATQALRLRSTRSLWDPTYTDESWINDKVRLIPRMKDWVSGSYPGTGVAISEYNWGGLESINGALAQADVLGIFGREGLDLATLWGPPTSGQPGAYAFRMFRNYDGRGSGFGDIGVKAASANQGSLSVYAAQRSGDAALTVMVINKTGAALTSSISLSGFTPRSAASVYRYSPARLAAIDHPADQPLTASGFSASFPANSITLFEILQQPMTLTVNCGGGGDGTVTSVPSGISCQSGTSAGCTAGFPVNSSVTLHGTASSGSAFGGWSGGCGGKSDCTVSMDSERTVTAAFVPAPYVRIGAASYASLQDAYDAASAGDTIRLMAGILAGQLTADRAIDITVSGGYDAEYLANSSRTAVQGAVIVRQGSVRMGRVNLR